MPDAPTTPPRPHDAADVDIDLSDARILLVDDNQQNLELMQAYLETLPCETVTATNGEEAARLVEQTAVDLILLDIMMPRMSGSRFAGG